MAKYNTRRANQKMPRKIVKEALGKKDIVGSDDDITTSIEASKKRKELKVPEGEREPKKIKKTSNTHDSYCWKCHKIEGPGKSAANDEKIECSTCRRAFHSFCIKAKKMSESGSCYECQQLAKDKETVIIEDDSQLRKLLLSIVDIACPINNKEYKHIVDWPDLKENDKLICKRDVNFILDKCNQKGIQYETPAELVDDVKWIHHNCMIIYGEKDPIVKSSKKLLEKINRELTDASDCLECYYKKIGNEPLSFLHICTTPHPLVWAKEKFFPYWPAKCLRVVNKRAHVRYFGRHEMGFVQLSNVLAMSENYPTVSSNKNSKNRMNYIIASNELEAYIGIFQDQYEKFPFQKLNSPFNFEKEEKTMKELLEKHTRRRIVSGDTFLRSPDNEPEPPPTLVDLTDDDDDQLNEDQSPPIQQDNFPAVSPKDFQIIHEAVSGTLLPSADSPSLDDRQMLSPSAISITNVVSGTDITPDSSTDLLEQVANCESDTDTQNSLVVSIPQTETDSFFSQNISNSIVLRTRQTSETAGLSSHPSTTQSVNDEDIEIIEEVPDSQQQRFQKNDNLLQSILRNDPTSFTALKQANMLVQELFIHFWGQTSHLDKPFKVLKSQECEIRDLKVQLEQIKSELSEVKHDFQARLNNADNVVKRLKTELNKATKKCQEYEKFLKDLDQMHQEKIEDLKATKQCSLLKCREQATLLCCYENLNSHAYCSLKCKEKDRPVHRKVCQSEKYLGQSKLPDDRSGATSTQTTIASEVVKQTVIYSSTSTVETHTVQAHISNKEKASSIVPQQTNLANFQMNKVISKKTVEVARNINKNQNATDMY